MKRFLILFTLIVFVTVSCAGPTKVRGGKQFEKDCEDCIQAVKDNPEQKMTVEKCLVKKGYGESKTAKAAITVAGALVIIPLLAIVVAAMALSGFGGEGGH